MTLRHLVVKKMCKLLKVPESPKEINVLLTFEIFGVENI